MKKGNKIFYIKYERGIGYSKAIESTEVTRVGNTYFEVANHPYRIKISLMRDGHDSDPHRRYFHSEKQIADFFERTAIESKVSHILRHFSVSKMTLEDLKLLQSLISKYEYI